GKSILYISHRLEEGKRMCDHATVLRHGKVVAHCHPRKETAASLARVMVGNDVEAVVREAAAPAGARAPLLEPRGLSRPRACADGDGRLAVAGESRGGGAGRGAGGGGAGGRARAAARDQERVAPPGGAVLAPAERHMADGA